MTLWPRALPDASVRSVTPCFCVNVLSGYLFDELGIHGNQEEYYDPRNSFLNEVLSRRLGIPISLSLLYIEVGKRLEVPLVGVGMPGHFMVRHRDVEDLFIDPFHGGLLLSEEECSQRLSNIILPIKQGGLGQCQVRIIARG